MLTQYPFYQEQQALHPDTFILMREYDSYYVLGSNADKAEKLLSDLLTHKDAGKCYTYTTAYSYHSFSFGRHNLHKVLPHLIREGLRVAISDYNEYCSQPDVKRKSEEIIRTFSEKQKAQEKKEAKKNPVQLSLFDEWAI